MSIPSLANTLNSGLCCPGQAILQARRVVRRERIGCVVDAEAGHGLKKAGSLSALIMVSTMSAAPWSSRSSSSSHIFRELARIGALSEGSRSIRVLAMQKAMPSLPILSCSGLGLLIADSLVDFDR